MNDEHIKTLVMDMATEIAKDTHTSAVKTTDAVEHGPDQQAEPTADYRFSQKYSFLT